MKRIITLGVILWWLLASSYGDLLVDGSNLQLTASQANQSLNTQLQIKCSKDTVQRLKYDQSDLSIQLSYNLLDIGMDLAATVIEFQKQKIELIQQKNIVRMSCQLSG